MISTQLDIDSKHPLQANAFGYKITLSWPESSLDEDQPVSVFILRPDGSSITHPGTIIDFDEATVEFVVAEGDFVDEGKHKIQVVQVGSEFKYVSPVGEFPVSGSVAI